MTSLKDFLIESIAEKIQVWKESITLKESTLESLRSIDLDNATYEISLHSMWESEGEKNIKIVHTGTLQAAIEKAEAEFKKINNRSDVQADRSACLIVGNDKCYIPKYYY